ncbi:deazapurine DNA modification protein DpdA family protein [Actinomadura sp. 3N407]|uniref:deazapurine DNA modification protein DpdA family protein n=1 Tax=Actinomadura sp. 3N407 TaxID=3457423 RepID=UPI003FCDA8AA
MSLAQSPPHPPDTPAARPMTFFLGTHRPSWLTFMDVPLFISASTIHRIVRELRRHDTHGCGIWAFDSGAYTANNPRTGGNPDHPWHLPADIFGGMVTRVVEQVGIAPQFAAPQDWPCEPPVRAVTGMSTRIHQELTTDSYEYLSTEFAFIDWSPVIQGWETADYIRHLRMYADRGIDLTQATTVGLGSVCRRGSAKPVAEIVETVQAYALQQYGRMLPLHGFGLNIRALRLIGHLLASSDSLAWSDGARHDHIRLSGCTHQSRYCNNCADYAKSWYRKVVRAIEEPKQLAFGLTA